VPIDPRTGERLPYAGDPGAPPAMTGPADPAMAGPPMLPPGEADMAAMPEDPEPAELAAMIGGQIAQQRQTAHAMVDQMADAQLAEVIGMMTQAAQGSRTLDGPGIPA